MSELSTTPSKRLVSEAAMWNVAAWALALAAFTIAVVVAHRQVLNVPNELRSPTLLVADMFLATVVALGFAWHGGSLTRWTDAQFCLRFGLWSAAVFRLLPPILNEGDGLFLRNCGTFDVPYVVLGACIHGGLAVLLACPYAIRVLDLPAWSDGESQWEMCGAVVLVFFIVAAIVRLLA